MQSYQTVFARATAIVVEKRSEFIAAISPAVNEGDALVFLGEIRAAHRTASHNVYAYSLVNEARQRYSDDGEPAKTAGLPVLSVLTHAGVTNCIIVVTRYFGGTLLGSGGLVRAYTSAAQAVLAAADISTVRLCIMLTLVLSYSQYEQVARLLEEAGARMDEPIFAENVTLAATLPSGEEATVLQALNEMARGNLNVSLSEPFFCPF